MDRWLWIVAIGMIVYIFIMLQVFFNEKPKQRVPFGMSGVPLDLGALEEYAKNISVPVCESGFDNHYKVMEILESDYALIYKIYQRISERDIAGKKIPEASRWILDNFYVVERQVRSIKTEFDKQDYRKLPIIKSGNFAMYPRIYYLAVMLSCHTDSKIDLDTAEVFLNAFQENTFLKSCEIRSFFVMVKVALIENIAHLLYEADMNIKTYEKAEELYAFLKDHHDEVEVCQKKIDGIFPDDKEINAYLLEHILYLLRRYPMDNSENINQITDRLASRGLSIDQVMRTAFKREAVFKLTMGNAMQTMMSRLNCDLSSCFFAVSYVEKTLREDPSGLYTSMSQETKMFYIKKVEEISRQIHSGEVKVAKTAVKLCSGKEKLLSHVGYYIVDGGQKELCSKLGKEKWQMSQRAKTYLYMTAAFLLTFVLCALFFMWIGGESFVWGFVFAILTAAAFSQTAFRLLDFVFLRLNKGRELPMMDPMLPIEEEDAVLTVITSLLITRKDAEKLTNSMETYFLANKENNSYFGLLTDYKDGKTETTEEEIKTRLYMQERIEALNQKYGGTVFYWFHRDKVFCKGQNSYMGYERKRGALVELVRLLKGNTHTSITSTNYDGRHFHYIFTVDSDTRIYQKTVKKLWCAAVHPLNIPIIDKERAIVTGGYALFAPRIDTSQRDVNKSLFAKIFSGGGGLTSYAQSAGDFYGDVFGESIYTGKGLFDIDVFYLILDHAFPENRILSHDLLEGCFLRCAYLSSAGVCDGFPLSYMPYMKRLHRWIRGDVQVAQWILPRVPTPDGKHKNPLSVLSRFKIADNIRRSFVCISLTLGVLLALCFHMGGYIALALYLVVFAIDVLRQTFIGIFQKGFMMHMSDLWQSLCTSFWLAISAPYQGYISLQATVISKWRLCISHKNLLEWTTASEADRAKADSVGTFYRKMQVQVYMGLLVAILAFRTPYISSWIIGSVIAILWVIAPMLLYQIGKPIEEKSPYLSHENLLYLRSIAYRTFCYYDDLVDAEHHFLAPDNYQLPPCDKLSERTSPTNIGIQIMAYIAGRDFGYLTTSAMVWRLEGVLHTIESMPKYHGHLYNWYDTKTLEVLNPPFISTVDSGNYVGFLTTTKEALIEYQRRPLIDLNLLQGISDVIFQIKDQSSIKLNDKALYDLLLKKTITVDEVSLAMDDLCFGGYEEETKELKHLSSMVYGIKEEIKLIKNGGFPSLKIRMDSLISHIQTLINETSFDFLYNPSKNLLSVGYDTTTETLSNSYYDLLSSEARISSILAIARKDVPEKHWFTLGRLMVRYHNKGGMLSWTGTMFEYLMPYLLLSCPRDSLLYKTYHFMLMMQQNYAKKKHIPWGISESGYYAFDEQLNYQYKAFGVPTVALKRETEKETVVAPYATLLALMVDLDSSIANLKRLESMGMFGQYGFFEAIDFTNDSEDFHSRYHIIKSYMVHHLGMGFLSISNVLFDNIMQKRFHRDLFIQSVDYLTEERFKLSEVTKKEMKEEKAFKKPPYLPDSVIFHDDFNPVFPKMYALSNGNYTTVIDEFGNGYAKEKNVYFSRYREDSLRTYGWYFTVTCDESHFKIADVLPQSGEYQTVFQNGVMNFRHVHGKIETKMSVCAAPEDSMEIRWITILNHGEDQAQIAVDSYNEVILSRLNDDIAHPAFGNLFVTTDYDEENSSLVAIRKRRGEQGKHRYGFAKILSDKPLKVSYETDRMLYVKETSHIKKDENGTFCDLQNSKGAVLDPVFAMRVVVSLEPGEQASFYCLQGMAETKEEMGRIQSRYKTAYSAQKCLDIWQEKYRMQQRYLEIAPKEEEEFLEVLTHFHHISVVSQKNAPFIFSNTLGQSDLWSLGISGEKPIICANIEYEEEQWYVEKMLRCYHFYRVRGISYDLVFLIHETDSYKAPIQHMIDMRIHGLSIDVAARNGIFVFNLGKLSSDQMDLLRKVAVLSLSTRYDLEDVIKEKEYVEIETEDCYCHMENEPVDYSRADLDFYNGYGGFKKENSEYVMLLQDGNTTPLPWSHVLSNENFGSIVTQSGGGYTYMGNSRENKLTPWVNDPVYDVPGERIYIKDCDSKDVFSPTQSPCMDKGSYRITYGMGYAIYEHEKDGIVSSETVFVPVEDRVKIVKLSLKNEREKTSHLSITYYIKPVLGVGLSATSRFISTWFDECLFAKNTYNSDFPDVAAFVATSEKDFSYTTDDNLFVRTKNDIPLGVCLDSFPNDTGAGRESCLCIKINLTLKPQKSHDVIFLFGEDAIESGKEIFRKYQAPKAANDALIKVKQYYQDMFAVLKVETDDKATDIMLNGYLLYQTFCCRLRARSAFYQAGGAFGFRDQLQDVLCLLLANPEIARLQILKHAAHQFIEGDVLHWWHEVKNPKQSFRGVRTRFSDDRVWLVYVTCEYIKTTGDMTILDEIVPYIEGEILQDGEDEKYLSPHTSGVSESLYEHLIRVLLLENDVGQHGLLKMGSGDWNDGMNTVGNKGQGESVWLSMFLRTILADFLPIMKDRKDSREDIFAKLDKNLNEAISNNAWDGDWYRRAYFDDGTPLGSKQNEECQIDSLSQSFAVISNTGDREKQEKALNSAKKYLVKESEKIILLLDPPFSKGDLRPGYIAEYLPGVRENGGQYTHGAVWLVMAMARANQNEDALMCYQMLNPIYHSDSLEMANRYKVEPYAITADVYHNPQHMGRGGWSLYTGSASWYYKVGVEEILGFQKRGNKLLLNPKLPKSMSKVHIQYRFLDTFYDIIIKNPNVAYNSISILVDQKKQNFVPLKNDKKTHKVEVLLS